MTQDEARPDRQAIVGLVFLVLIGFLNYIDRAALSVLQVPIKAELGLSDSQLGVLTGVAFFVPYCLFAIPIGRLSDVWVRKYVLAIGLLLWSVMTGLVGFAHSFLVVVLLRIGLATGEATFMPPSYSLLADYFAPTWRGRAIALFALAFPIGSMLGIALSGALANALGWRASFWIFGATGILLVPLYLIMTREPQRGAHAAAEAGATPGAAPGAASLPFAAALRTLWAVRPLRFMAVASGLQTYVAAVVIAWNVPFFMRVHDVSLGNVALVFAIITGIGGTCGTFLAGYISDRLGRTDRRWYLWMPVLTCFATVPAALTQLLAPSSVIAFFCAGLVASVVSAFSPPTFAITQSLVAANLRALASSFIATCISIGGAFGPTVTGILSDYLGAYVAHAPDALRYAMATVVIPSSLAALLFYRASSLVSRSDLARA